jgi:uncharacterized RDD family membrane protein YckC
MNDRGKPDLREEPELVEAQLVEPAPERSPGDGAIDLVLNTAGRVLEPVARLGWRGARRVGRGLGINRALERTLDRGIDRALESEAAERATERVLESEGAKRVWDKVLASDEAQRLVERVAEAPEVRSAITSQGVGLLEDVRRSARRAARTLDDAADRIARGARRRRQRHERPIYAGAATRGLAIALDGAILSGILLLLSTLLALLISTIFSLEGDAKAVTIAFGALAWAVAAGIYLAVFWTLAERTPGMTFFGLRILTEEGAPVPPGQDLRRLVGFALALIPLGLGFAGILLDERRRGWHDRYAGTVVLYADPEIDPGVDRTGHQSRSPRK